MAERSFPSIGFLVLGLLSIAAAAVFVARALVVDPTAERVFSAIMFTGFGLVWLWAYQSDRQRLSK